MFNRLGRDFGFRAFITTILVVAFVFFVFGLTFMYQGKDISKDVLIVVTAFSNIVSLAVGHYFGNRSAMDIQYPEKKNYLDSEPP